MIAVVLLGNPRLRANSIFDKNGVILPYMMDWHCRFGTAGLALPGGSRGKLLPTEGGSRNWFTVVYVLLLEAWEIARRYCYCRYCYY